MIPLTHVRGCKEIQKKYQPDAKMIIHMNWVGINFLCNHLINKFQVLNIKDGVLKKAHNECYLVMTGKIEPTAAASKTDRLKAISQLTCPKAMMDELTSSRPEMEKLVTDLKILRKGYLFCDRAHCQCGYCLLQKEEAKKLAEKSLQVVQVEIEQNHEAKVRKVQEAAKKEADVKVGKINEDWKKLFVDQQIQMKKLLAETQAEMKSLKERNQELTKENRKLKEENQTKDALIQDLLNQPPINEIIKPAVTVYTTATGGCYHTYPQCPGLSRANAVYTRNLVNVQGALRPCMRC